VRLHGAKGDGQALDTVAIQAAIDGCGETGGGTVLIPAWGLFARNVQTLTWEDVRFSLATDDVRPVVVADRAERLNLDGFTFTRVPGVSEPIVTTNVGKLLQHP
jgi:hypothetical protein